MDGTRQSHPPARDGAGGRRWEDKPANVAILAFVLLLSAIDVVAPPLGIPIAVLFIWLVLRKSRTGWAGVGMRRPASWIRTLGIGVVAALFLQTLALFLLVPVLRKLGVEPPDYSRFEAMRGNVPMLVGYLAVSWTTAGFGEEIIWRGFLLGRLARVLGGGRVAWGLALFLTSVFFGLLHTYQGVVGMVLTGCTGLVLGILYLAGGRNLWLPIVAHGTMDTLSFLILFTGAWKQLV